ncbi:hypothetical protein [Kineococcus terrestris]|uniref:hypothetical protein n=1 Tax=Kineococcus terrestris TaxID=2044856 RepID=UPI0034DB42E3
MRGRVLVVRLVALLLALSWLVFPGFGLIDLSVTWDPGWDVVLEAGWGLFFTIFVGTSFVAVAVVPRRAEAALAQLGCATLALVVAAALSADVPALVLTAVLAVQVALVARTGLTPLPRPVRWEWDAPLTAVTAVAAPAWLAYGWQMAGADRRGVPTDEITVGVNHYAVQAATAFALVLVPALASCWPRGRRFTGTSTALVAAYLGLIAYAWPGEEGGFGAAWSLAAMTWALVVAVLTWRPTPRPRVKLAPAPADTS